jgi:hypothetical protein
MSNDKPAEFTIHTDKEEVRKQINVVMETIDKGLKKLDTDIAAKQDGIKSIDEKLKSDQSMLNTYYTTLDAKLSKTLLNSAEKVEIEKRKIDEKIK